jgi:hypothetical protein
MTVAWGPPARASEPLLIYSAMGLALLLAARFYPFETHPVVVCPLRAWAHVPCLTCGMTRAFVRIVHGQWGGAFRVSPLGALLALLAAGFAVYALLRLVVLRRSVELRLSRGEALGVRIGTVAGVLGNWLYLLLSGAAG